uniref:Uncharacterized protein n=1 Tax=Nelumbo nucifera TaxID=4432 RepID=A0A822ZUK8_NELNU|nr:TPA_asm: hypothetical protein HUJ06_016972 [Nelumbo nucifera]
MTRMLDKETSNTSKNDTIIWRWDDSWVISTKSFFRKPVHSYQLDAMDFPGNSAPWLVDT